MPPKAPPAKPPPSPPKGKEKGGKERGGKGKGGKGSKGKPKRHKLNLKGWLKTAADWARFDAWVKINALPKKVPEPEPIVRPSKPLGQLKKRMIIMATPKPAPDMNLICRSDLSVSKAAQKCKPSKRTKQLAMFIERDEECGRDVPLPITHAALIYQASIRIMEIAEPKKVAEVESCKDLSISKNALKHKTTAREKRMALAKKAITCPGTLSDKERAKLMTSMGIMRKALTYKITEWMLVLALPSYKFLKDRKDSDAKEWKKQLADNQDRGKKALEEQQQREEKEKEKKTGKKSKPKDKGEKDKKTEEGDAEKEDEGDAEKEDEGDKDKGEGDKDKGGGDKDKGEGDKKDSKKKAKKYDWRKEPNPCKEDAFSVSKAAKNAKASARTEEISKPTVHENQSIKKDPFSVKKGALNATASPRTEEMAKPNRPLDPVERPPPREKDKYGAPIFPKPKFGKVLPKVKPYKEAVCKDKDEKEEKPKREKRVDSIALSPSIDPCLDPIGAKRQAKARKAAKEAKKNRKKKKKKKNEEGEKKEDEAPPEKKPEENEE